MVTACKLLRNITVSFGDRESHLLLYHNIPINDFNRPYKAQNMF